MGDRLAGRYQLVSPLGAGGMGEVWRAHDLREDLPVAVKLLRAPAPAAARRELAALRWLRLSGVVGLRDDGAHLGTPFLVMDLVEGAPFPGLPSPQPWPALAAPARRLLETLAQIHRAGVVHRDLKPANVLVDRQGRPTVLDLGLAVGAAVDVGPRRGGGGTPLTMAPEQIRGEPVGPQADLYALGVMLYTALAGQPPHPGQGAALLSARLEAPPPPLASRAPDAPPEVAALIDRLLARDPAARPRAHEALATLGAPPTRLRLPERVPRRALRRLFAGSDLLDPVRRDAAALLASRAGEHGPAIAAELDRWIEQGFATYDHGRVRLDRPGLERLQLLDALDGRGRPDERRLTRLLARGAPSHALLRAAEDTAGRLLRAGQLPRAEAMLGWALGLARQEERAETERRLLRATARAALGQESPPAVDRARYQLERALVYDDELTGLGLLLQAGRAAWAGEADRAEALLSRAGPMQDADLDILARGFGVITARARGEEAEEGSILALADWATADPRRAAYRDSWLGSLRYRQARYAEAAALHAAAAQAKGSPVGALASTWLVGASLLELGRLDEAAAAGARLTRQARRLRLASYEGLGRFLTRSAACRAGQPLRPNPALVQAASRLGPGVAGPLGVVEAAIAWRAGRSRLCARLAAGARAHYEALNLDGPAVLMAALELAAGPRQPAAALAPLACRALAQDADFAVQSIGLLRRICELPAAWIEAARALAAARPAEQWSWRLDVLSFDESLT